MAERITLSVIKADVGGYVGHSGMHNALIEEAAKLLERAQRDGVLLDFHVTRCGDDLELIMTYKRDIDDEGIHRLAWEVFEKCTQVARDLKLYGAGQDHLAEAFSGTVRGMGHGVA